MLIGANLSTEDTCVCAGIQIGVGDSDGHIHSQTRIAGSGAAADGGLELDPGLILGTVLSDTAPADAILVYEVLVDPNQILVAGVQAVAPQFTADLLVDSLGSQIGNRNLIIYSVNVIVVILPMGIESFAVQTLGNLGHRIAVSLVLIQIPAHENLAAVGNDCINGLCLSRIIVAGLRARNAAAIGFQSYSNELCRLGDGVHTVEVHIGLNHPALVIVFVSVPPADSVQEFASGSAAGNGSLQVSGTVDPSSAVVKGEQHHGIMLLLGQGQTLLAGKAVDSLIQFLQLFAQSRICLGLSDFVFLVTLTMVSLCGATGTVTGITICITGAGVTLQLLQNRDCLFTGLEGSCRCRQCRGRDQADQHEQSQ